MRMSLVIITPLIACAPEQAEFLMAPSPGEALSSDAAPAASPAHKPRPHAIDSQDPSLHGFGNGIPLNFAVRQIVPSHFSVTFGPGVDRDAAVDWKGGKPWKPTLFDAIRPLALVASVEKTTVTILAAPPSR
jgi:hypothetical protein